MKKLLIAFLLPTLFITSCLRDTAIKPDTGYPTKVAAIISTKCSITGCHTANAKEAAGGLNMETWDALFEGGNAGSVVIPYRADESWLLYFVNTDTSRGIALEPTMPYNPNPLVIENEPLSDEEYYTLKNWIDDGAPDEHGKVAFSGDVNRQKFYVANQGCDLVTVFDTKTRLAMRYVDAGTTDQVESPHQIRVSPDGQYWYAVFIAGTVIQRFRTDDDSPAGSIDIGPGSWNTFYISPDGTEGFAVDWEDDGKIAFVDLENMNLFQYYQGSGLFIWPHGITANPAYNTLYVTAQYGNVIYKIDITNPFFPSVENIVIAPGQAETFVPGTIDPHEIMFSPNGEWYFITCTVSNEVRVMDANADTLVAAIPVGAYPVEMSMSLKHPYLFVTCMEDACAEPLCKGSVWVIDYETLSVVKELQSGLYQPHGIAVDDDNDLVVVASRNVNPDGPAPHHSSECGGRNGFLKFIDLNTLEFTGYRPEVSVDPYSVMVR